MSPSFSMAPGETLIETIRANRSQGARAVGGQLHLTSTRMVFTPHGLESQIGGRAWQAAWGEVCGVTVAPRGWRPFDGSLARRLRVDTVHGVEHFVVPHVDQVLARVEACRR